MELGQKIRQARLQTGLSQRQLCDGLITRNMLSQIENGSARPSMDTLRQLAARLDRPVSYFFDEAPPVPKNQAILQQARVTPACQRLQLLSAFQSPDPLLDPERWLLEALTCLELAETAISQQKFSYARALLEQADSAGSKTPYYPEETRRRRLLLCFRAGVPAREVAAALSFDDTELLLRACDATESGQPRQALAFLGAVRTQTPYCHFLLGKAYEALSDHSQAVVHYTQAQAYDPQQVYGCLERCYCALGDYQQAYFYACQQR